MIPLSINAEEIPVRNKRGVIALVAALALSAYACTMPNIEIQFDVPANIPLGLQTFNIAEMLSVALGNSFPEDFEIYYMENYQNSMAFLIGYQMELMKSFNPDEYLGNIRTQIHEIDNIGGTPIDPVSHTISIPAMIPESKPPEIHWFDMMPFFEEMEAEINDHSMPATSIPFVAPAGTHVIDRGQLGLFDNLPSFMAFRDDTKEYNFDSVVVEEGRLVVTFTLSGDGGGSVPAGTILELPGLQLIAEGSPSNKVHGVHPGPITLTSAVPSVTVEFDLADEEIERDYPPKFVFDAGNVECTSGDHAILNLIITPQARDLALRGAIGLRIGEMTRPLERDLIDNITLDIPDDIDLLNAEINEGVLSVFIQLPEWVDSITTYCEGLTTILRLRIVQNPVVFDGQSFYGLSGTAAYWETEIDSTINEGKVSLAGMLMSGGKMDIIEADIIVTADPDNGASFELFDGDKYDEFPGVPDAKGAFRDRSLPIAMSTGIDITRLNVVRWIKDEDLIPAPKVPDINFGEIGSGPNPTNMAEFVESILFEHITLDIDFSPDDHPEQGGGLHEALWDRISVSLRMHCDRTDVYRVDEQINDRLKDGPNLFRFEDTMLFTRNGVDGNGDIIPNTLKVELDFIPLINGVPDATANYIELGPLTLEVGKATEMELFANGGFDFAWKEVVVDLIAALENADTDLSMLEGTYPEENNEPVNIYEHVGQYMSGITLGNNVQIKMFLNGPSDLINTINEKADITLSFGAEWDDQRLELLPDNFRITMETLEEFPPLSGDYVFSGSDFSMLPGALGGGVNLDSSGFADIIAAMPHDLRFGYNLELPSRFTITPGMFDDVEEGEGSGINALLVIIMPMELTISPGGYFAYNMSGDLFGRDRSGQSLFGLDDLDIKKLDVFIDFQPFFFNNAFLHIGSDLDDQNGMRVFGPGGLTMTDGNKLHVTLNQADIESIIDNYPISDIRIIFPAGSNLLVPKNFMPTRMYFDIAGSYVIPSDFFGY